MSNKSPEMEKFLDSFTKRAFGQKYTDTSKCAMCGSNTIKPEDFRDDLSRKEWEISHLCQECQDKCFEECNY